MKAAEKILGRKRSKKPKKVSLGKKGSFTIKKPGDFRRRAQRAGKSTREYAREEKGAKGVLGREARSAMGLMAMKHGK